MCLGWDPHSHAFDWSPFYLRDGQGLQVTCRADRKCRVENIFPRGRAAVVFMLSVYRVPNACFPYRVRAAARIPAVCVCVCVCSRVTQAKVFPVVWIICEKGAWGVLWGCVCIPSETFGWLFCLDWFDFWVCDQSWSTGKLPIWIFYKCSKISLTWNSQQRPVGDCSTLIFICIQYSTCFVCVGSSISEVCIYMGLCHRDGTFDSLSCFLGVSVWLRFASWLRIYLFIFAPHVFLKCAAVLIMNRSCSNRVKLVSEIKDISKSIISPLRCLHTWREASRL